MLNETLRARWFSACLHGGLWLLLILAVAGIGGRKPQFGESETDPGPVPPPVPVMKLETLFAPDNLPKQVVDPNAPNAFATAYFMPAAVPVITPTTRRVELTYQGYFQASGGPVKAMLLFGQQLVAIPEGGVVVSNLWVGHAAFQTLTLTNSAGQTNVLTVNVKKDVEVPLK